MQNYGNKCLIGLGIQLKNIIADDVFITAVETTDEENSLLTSLANHSNVAHRYFHHHLRVYGVTV